MTQWSDVTLNELGSVERGKSRHRPRNDPQLFGGTMPFFQTGDVKSAVLHVTAASKYYSEFGIAQSQIWDRGATCITIAANIAETAVLGRRGCFPDSILGFTPIHQASDAYFVKYLLDVHRVQLTSVARGTTQDNLSLEKLLSHRFRVPDPGTRARIAGVLSSYDDLIENNTRRIQILEEMAQTIYREWFVEFRYPGHENVPLVDSELGPVPEGWQTVRLQDAVELAYGKALKADDRNGGPVPVFGSGGLVGWHDVAIAPGPGIVVGRKGNVGSIYWSDSPFFAIDTTYFVKTKLPSTYVLYLLKGMEFIDSHAAVPGLSRDQAYGLPAIVPDTRTPDIGPPG